MDRALYFACYLRVKTNLNFRLRRQKLTLSEGWRDVSRIAKGRKNGADELHTLATALEVTLEEYEDGKFETLGELLDFHIDELKELREAERDVSPPPDMLLP